MLSQTPMCRQACLLEECRVLQKYHRDGKEREGAKGLLASQTGLPDCNSSC